MSSTNIKTSLRYPPLTEPSQAFRSIDKMVTLETHTLHECNVKVAQRCSVILVYQVLTLLDAKLATASAATPLAVPRFSKSHDDCADDAQITQRPDFVFLEGWCVGGHADCIEAVAQNDWEIEHDANAIWKSWTHEAARAYQQIWDKCDAMMLLRQENFEAVIDSRWIQEQGNAAASGVWQFSDRAAVAEFCAHYQSWTLGIWADLTPRADFVIGRTPSYDYYSMRG